MRKNNTSTRQNKSPPNNLEKTQEFGVWQESHLHQKRGWQVAQRCGITAPDRNLGERRKGRPWLAWLKDYALDAVGL